MTKIKSTYLNFWVLEEQERREGENLKESPPRPKEWKREEKRGVMRGWQEILDKGEDLGLTNAVLVIVSPEKKKIKCGQDLGFLKKMKKKMRRREMKRKKRKGEEGVEILKKRSVLKLKNLR